MFDYSFEGNRGCSSKMQAIQVHIWKRNSYVGRFLSAMAEGFSDFFFEILPGIVLHGNCE